MSVILVNCQLNTIFVLVGLLYERTHTKNINDYGSLLKITPKLAFFTIIAFIAGVGLPGTGSFVAELYVMVGSFQEWKWGVIFLSIGVLVSATYAVRTIKRLFTGPARRSMSHIGDLKPVEMLAATVLTLGILALGFYPSPFLDLIFPTVERFVGDMPANIVAHTQASVE